MVLDRLRIACFRFEKISMLLSKKLLGAERHRYIISLSKQEIIWPSGSIRTISVKTLYLWYKLYISNPVIESLMPKVRQSSIYSKVIKQEWILYALALIEEEPQRSLYILTLKIQYKFQLKNAPSKSSLYRMLKKESRYLYIRKRAKGQINNKGRFQAAFIHQIWQADAKGKFKVMFTNRKVKEIQVLTILDDCSRYVLRAIIVKSESSQAAIRCFRQAAARYGLCDEFYTDKGSAYDSDVFRKGLAILGIHKIKTKARNPSAHGKIENYHKTLKRWFVLELKHQPVLDEDHLQSLLDAFISELYNKHYHSELKKTIEEAFENKISDRTVSIERLKEAFMVEKTYTTNRKTRNIRVNGILYKIPNDTDIRYQRKFKIIYDLENREEVYLVKQSNIKTLLKPAVRIRTKKHKSNKNANEPTGSLTPLLEKYRGRTLPAASPGFGLPEIYDLFANVLGRFVPDTEREASLITDWLKDKGPFDPENFKYSLKTIVQKIGKGRPLSEILKELEQKIKKGGK